MATHSPAAGPERGHPVVVQLGFQLGQLASVVSVLSDQDYRAERAREVSGSVGRHVRHCLDHVSALVAALDTRRVAYDARVRGTAVETRRDVAIAEARRLAQALAAIRADQAALAIDVEVATDPACDTRIRVRSTVERELAFVASHTIHHFAVVALLLRDMGIGVPARFGYAPSTPSPELAA